jgi:hypothetical protein
MPSSEMLRHVALIRTDFSDEHSTSIIRVTRIGELGTTLEITGNRRTMRRYMLRCVSLAVSTPILVTLMMGALRFSETSLLTRDTRRNIPEDGILHYYYLIITAIISSIIPLICIIIIILV